jgi:hypothetical protein
VRARHETAPAESAGLAAAEVYGSCRRDSVGGISIGWGDIYGSRISGQELDISALADDAYCLVSRADPENRLLESNERNSVRTTRIVLRGEAIEWRPTIPAERSWASCSTTHRPRIDGFIADPRQLAGLAVPSTT